MKFSFRVLLNGGDEENPASKTDMETKEGFLIEVIWGHDSQILIWTASFLGQGHLSSENGSNLIK